MKKNLVSLAVAATVASAATTAVQAQVYVNPEKTGQVLLFPFYNADNGNATNMHIVNTTGDTKAVKVRFMEWKNSDEVLDFNLYLSPQDHFAFGVIKNPNGEGAAVITSDNSCTVPALGSANGEFSGTATTKPDGSVERVQPFVNFQYDDDADSSLARTMTGHVEVIEMGIITSAVYAGYAKHNATGMPAKCSGLEDLWASGVWSSAGTDGSASSGLAAPTGGLYGLASHIQVESAAAFGFEPTALDDWALGINHTNPGSLLPTLNSGTPQAVVHSDSPAGGDDNHVVVTMNSGAQAVSATVASVSLSNDVMTNAAIGGETDWVINFPTKRLHVDKAPPAVAPFTKVWVGPTKEVPACEVVTVEQWDREEAVTKPTNGFSPAPDAVTQKICYETRVVAMGTSAKSAMNVENGKVNLSYPYSEGWQRITMTNSDSATDGTVINGLPVLGFAAYKINNGAMSYGHAAEHKTDQVVSVASANDS